MSSTSIEILTPRLRLVPATPELGRAELDRSPRLGEMLGASIPASWPPPLNDEDSMRWFLQTMEEHPDEPGWAMWYFVRAGAQPLAIGNGGFKGPPDPEGTVEIGYSVIPEYQRLGLASEAVGALLGWAFAHAVITRVTAHTLPDLTPSIRVLEKLGFSGPVPGEESGTIRFELPRSGFSSRMETKIRSATEADIPEMHRIRMAVRENRLIDETLVQPVHYEGMLRGKGRGWVAEIDGRVAGFAIADLSSSSIWALFVDPELEGRGIGRRLHDVMLDSLFVDGAETLFLGTDEGTRAERFYRSAGWRQVGAAEGREARFEISREQWTAARRSS